MKVRRNAGTAWPGCKLLAWVLLPNLLLFAGYAATAEAAHPNVILITIDTVRADRMGFLGSKRGLTPNLDALAGRSVIFSRAYSQVPLTNPSHATILTGTYPQFHRVNDFAIPLTKDLPDLPELLQKQGYHTAAFVGASILDPKGTAPGFDRGFDTYEVETRSFRPAGVVVEHALLWLKSHHDGPFFLWIHLYDAHAPYVSPDPFKSRYQSAPYDGAVAYVDSVLGELIKDMRSLSVFDNTVIALMSDHGEALGDHGEREHGYLLYDETIHVPLLIKLPAAQPSAGYTSGKVVEAGVGLVDVAPTILQVANLPVPVAMQGQSLVPLMLEKTETPTSAPEMKAPHPIYSETDYPYLAYGWSPLRALRSNRYLFIEAPRKELYDRDVDLRAEHNRAETSPAIAVTLNSLLDEFRRKTAGSSEVPQAVVDAEKLKQLNALGYVASSHAEAHPDAAVARADPKDKIEIANRMTDALRDMSMGRYREAAPLIEHAAAQEPENPVINRLLGEAYLKSGDYKSAITPLRKALKSRSDAGAVHQQLGLALFALQDWNGAETEFTSAVAKSPSSAEGHYWLGSTYSRLRRYPEAEKELEATLQFQPDNFPANMELGQVFLIERNPEKALLIFKKAAELEPQMGDPHHFLAQAYSRLGQTADAQREGEEADRLRRANRQ